MGSGYRTASSRAPRSSCILRPVRRGLLLLVLAGSLAAVAAIAAAASTAVTATSAAGSVALTVMPNRPAAASALAVRATGAFTAGGGLPTSVNVRVQKGFATSVKSVKTLCTATQAKRSACPASSRIGGGNLTATGTLLFITEQDEIGFKLFLARTLRRGDIASIVLAGTDSLLHESAHATGRLLKAPSGGLELLFAHLPNLTPPAGATVTLDSLTLKVHAARTVKTRTGRRHYSLITNPRSCASSWHGNVTVAFPAGPPLTRALAAPCVNR